MWMFTVEPLLHHFLGLICVIFLLLQLFGWLGFVPPLCLLAWFLCAYNQFIAKFSRLEVHLLIPVKQFGERSGPIVVRPHPGFPHSCHLGISCHRFRSFLFVLELYACFPQFSDFYVFPFHDLLLGLWDLDRLKPPSGCVDIWCIIWLEPGHWLGNDWKILLLCHLASQVAKANAIVIL